MKKLIVVFISLFLFSCGGGSSSTPSTAPTITGLYPTNVSFYAATGTILKTFSYTATYKGCLTSYINVTDNVGTSIWSTSNPVSGSCNLGSGLVYISFPVDTTGMVSGESGFIVFDASDNTGLHSNKLTAAWNVY